MANTPRSSSPDLGEVVNKASNSPAGRDAKDDLAALRADLGRLSDTVAALLSGQAEQVKGAAADKANELYASGREALRTVETQARGAADDLSRKVVDNPLSSVAIAFGLGYIYALMRRGR